jgi:hypothetical protein
LCCSDGEENVLPDNTLITDILIDIEKKQVVNKFKYFQDINPKRNYHLSLKIKEFFLFDFNDQNSIDIYFSHMVNDFLKFRFLLSEEKIVELGALKAIADFGNLTQNEGRVPILAINCERGKHIISYQ